MECPRIAYFLRWSVSALISFGEPNTSLCICYFHSTVSNSIMQPGNKKHFYFSMYLPFWAKGPAAGFMVCFKKLRLLFWIFQFLLLKFPWTIVGTRLLWFTWQNGEHVAFYGVPSTAFCKTFKYKMFLSAF